MKLSCPQCNAKTFHPSIPITDIDARIGYDEEKKHFYILSEKMSGMKLTCENGHKFEIDGRKAGYIR